MEISKIKLIDIEPADYNPRTITDEAKKKLRNSIETFGLVEPIIINTKNNRIIGGHQRYQILLDLCMENDNLAEKEYDYLVKDDYGFIFDSNKLTIENEDYEKALNIVLNNTNLMGDYDYQKLEGLLTELEFNGFNLEFTGFDNLDDVDIDLLGDEFSFGDETEFTETVEDDYDFPVEEELDVTVELGDLYQLGNHRLLCGDATKEEDVEKLMQGAKADLLFTDPPYNMEAQGGSNQWVGKSAKKIGEAIKDLCDFDPTEFLNILGRLFDGNMNSYIFCNKDLVPTYLDWARDEGHSFNILFWKKPNALLLGQQHRPDVEYLLFFRKGAIWNNGIDDATYSKCLEFGREHSTPHPTMKPVELIGNELKISSNKQSIVVDLFGGSGSTLIACEQLNRNCYMMELDPYYCQVIINRWEEFTGGKAELIERLEE